jgi:hypothetical protein
MFPTLYPSQSQLVLYCLCKRISDLPMKIAPEVMAFLVDPEVLAAASESRRTYGAPND